jgi:4-oxalocrotonate tautomerase
LPEATSPRETTKVHVAMPLVNIRLARRDSPITAQQKAELIAGVTELMHKALAKRPESVVVIIDEVDPENWGEGGESVTAIRKRRQGGSSGGKL